MTEWYSLFDTGTRDHVIEMMKTGDPAAPLALLNQLMPMIESYQAENIKPHGMHIGIREAKKLKSTVRMVARMIDPQEIDRHWVERFGDLKNADLKREIADSAYRVSARLLHEAWTGFIAAGAGHLQYHEKPRQLAAVKKGQRASAESKQRRTERLVAEAMRRFDPGPESGLSDSRRAEIILERAQKMEGDREAPFPDADKLPKSLRKYLKRHQGQ